MSVCGRENGQARHRKDRGNAPVTTAAIRIDPETGRKIFNTRAAKASDRIAGKGYSIVEDETLKTLPPPRI